MYSFHSLVLAWTNPVINWLRPMVDYQHILTPLRIRRIREQGYYHQSDDLLSSMAVGNRFAYQLCTLFVLLGLVTSNLYVLTSMMFIALMAVVLPYHPFDYIYNYGLRHVLQRPRIPRRSKQLKFACAMATAWLATTIWLFTEQYTTAAYIVGGLLVASATLVSTTDICLPSKLYNAVFKPKLS